MKEPSRQNFLALFALAALALFLPLSAQAGSGLSSSAQHCLPSHSAFAEFNRIFFPDSTFMIDDGVSEYSVGLTDGGDLICLNEFAVIPGAS